MVLDSLVEVGLLSTWLMNKKERKKKTEHKLIIIIIRLCFDWKDREYLHGQVGADWIFIAKKRGKVYEYC